MGYTKNRCDYSRSDNYIWISTHEISNHEIKCYHYTYPKSREEHPGCKVWICSLHEKFCYC